MEHEIIYTKGYEQLKTEIREELNKSAESFVKIGYLLKVARDTNILHDSPYGNMEEFAQAEFGIDRGTASKFMSINDRFAENGYSERLRSEFSGIGWSKLSIMLQLPDSINEEITAGFSKQEIQTIRDEIAEEQKITPLERAIEGETAVTEQVEDLLSKAILQLGESNPQLYKEIHNNQNLEELKSIMAPSGEAMYSIRISGIGRMLLSLKDYEDKISLVNERTGEKMQNSWDDLAEAWMRIIDRTKAPEKNWEIIYGQQFPKKAEVAPVQLKKETKKVVKVNEKPKKEQEPAPIETFVEEPGKNPEENPEEKVEQQLPGQMEVYDYPDVVPSQEIATEAPEKRIDSSSRITREIYEKRKKVYLESYDNNIACAAINKETGLWDLAKQDLKDAMHFLDLLIELEDMEVEDEEKKE